MDYRYRKEVYSHNIINIYEQIIRITSGMDCEDAKEMLHLSKDVKKLSEFFQNTLDELEFFKSHINAIEDTYNDGKDEEVKSMLKDLYYEARN